MNVREQSYFCCMHKSCITEQIMKIGIKQRALAFSPRFGGHGQKAQKFRVKHYHQQH